MTDYAALEAILAKVDELRLPPREKTIFSIGGRGHYENPISDVLAFYLHPHEEHDLGDLFLRSLFECLKESSPTLDVPPPNLFLREKPSREITTDSGNRMDVFLQGDDWGMVIENKVRHLVNNPFPDYKAWLEANCEGKRQYCILLKPASDKADFEDGWHLVTWERFLKKLTDNSGPCLMASRPNKWHIFMRDFIGNIQNEIGGIKVNEARLKFVQKHYTQIYELVGMQQEYTDYLTEQCDARLKDMGISVRCSPTSTWKQHKLDPVVRLLDQRLPGSYLSLGVKTEGGFRIQFNLGGLTGTKVDVAYNRLKRKFRAAPQGFLWYETAVLDEAIDEFARVASEMTALYETSSPDSGPAK